MDRNNKAIVRINRHISRLLEFANEKTFDDFCTNHMLYDATVMNLLQIGEQATRLDDSFCIAHKNIPWSAIKSVRNRIAHNYDGVDASIVWQIVKEDLPELAINIAKINNETSALSHIPTEQPTTKILQNIAAEQETVKTSIPSLEDKVAAAFAEQQALTAAKTGTTARLHVPAFDSGFEVNGESDELEV